MLKPSRPPGLYRSHLANDENGRPRADLEVFSHLTRERFYELFGPMLDQLIADALGSFGQEEAMRARLFDFAYMIVTKPAFTEPYAGLVFAGFGSSDIFPVYVHHYASILVDGVIKRAHDETTAVGVDDGPNAFLRTFAQADMTHAFLRGIHPLMFDMMISMNLITNEAAAELALREAGIEPKEAGAVMERIGQGSLPALTGHFIKAAHQSARRIHQSVHPCRRGVRQAPDCRNLQGTGGAEHPQEQPAHDPDRGGRRCGCGDDLANGRSGMVCSKSLMARLQGSVTDEQ